MSDPFEEEFQLFAGRRSELVRKISIIVALVTCGVALIGAALWFVGPTLALIALLFLGAVIVPCCIQIARQKA